MDLIYNKEKADYLNLKPEEFLMVDLIRKTTPQTEMEGLNYSKMSRRKMAAYFNCSVSTIVIRVDFLEGMGYVKKNKDGNLKVTV